MRSALNVALALGIVASSSLALAQPAPKAAAPPTAAPPTAAPPAVAPPAEDAEAAPDPAKKLEAQERFQKGLKLLAEDAWTAALAEFLASRDLFPTRNATNNAAFCLRKLKRFDEALDLYESMLREYGTMPADKKEAARKEVAELRQLVGTIDVTGAEPGAAVVVDGRGRQDFPLLDPLRVSAGTHTVTLFKEGFQRFEATVDVAGGQTVRIEAKMPALQASGRLRVAEASGKTFDVVVDGAVVGVTPWEGTIAVGDHVVHLIGDADLGTQPSSAPVKVGEMTSLTLAVEPLEAGLFVKVLPTGASVTVDGVAVGRGIWDGRLRQGAHHVQVVADGYFPQKRDVTLDRGEREELVLELERDDSAEKWSLPSKIVIEAFGGFALSPTFNGDVQSSCDAGCSQSLSLGGLTMVHGGYEWGSGIGIGLAAGFMQASQEVTGRSTSLSPVGIETPLEGTASDELRLRGFLVGVTGAYRLGEDFPIRFRLGAGALIGQAHVLRSGTFTTRAGGNYTAPLLGSDQTAAFVYVDPEASIGVRVVDFLEIGAGVQALILIAAAAPTWGGSDNPTVAVPGDGLSSYDGDETTMGTTVFVVPGLHVRALF